MPITIGLIRELQFISNALRQPVEILMDEPVNNLAIKINYNILNIYYHTNHIWEENLKGPNSFFGIESCDAISRIIACIDNGDSNWIKYKHTENNSYSKSS